jgi:hypothetical protein
MREWPRFRLGPLAGGTGRRLPVAQPTAGGDNDSVKSAAGPQGRAMSNICTTWRGGDRVGQFGFKYF